jgi:catechol 2,3-dioxygenase-like lactoylglutathione lyase family enzyme
MKSHRAQHSIQLAVTNIAISEAFYAGILELPVQRSLTAIGAPDHLVLDMDGIALVFVEEDDVVRVTLHFEVRDLEGISDAVTEEGLEVLYPLEVKPYGIKEMWCFDPDGYLVVLDEIREKREKAGT